ncbi:MAG: hypothetical protein J5507_00840 [Clostridia bacterium]|nr:hypothetical protein [Clostridia bacterium]
MKDLMNTNIYDVNETTIIVGSCTKHIEPEGFKKIEEISNNILEICLEQTHMNMAISKICGMLRTRKIKKLIFASVDKSPHCIQLHYIQEELRKIMDIKDILIKNYVVVDNELIEIKPETISLSKNLSKLKEKMNK